MASTQQRQTADVPVEREECGISGENGAAAWCERKADKRRAAQNVFGVTLRRNPHDAAASAM
jgi:hypothetical protein